MGITDYVKVLTTERTVFRLFYHDIIEVNKRVTLVFDLTSADVVHFRL